MDMPSVTFISGNTRYSSFSDWKLAIDGTPRIALPRQKIQTVDIPGMDGVLDISNSLRIGGGPVFQNREGSFSFYFLDMSYYGLTDWDKYVDAKKSIIKQIIETVHGRFLNIETTDEPGVIYHGRFTVDGIEDGDPIEKITISYSLQPYPVGKTA